MITINFDKAKGICHEKRRAKRAEEFEPFDEIIMKQIPGKSATDAEKERQKIRDKHSTIQVSIEASTSVDDLLGIVATHSL